MKRIVLCAVLWLGIVVLTFSAAPPAPIKVGSSLKYLFVVDTSFSMAHLAGQTRQYLYDTIHSGMNGEMHPYDMFTLWTFNEAVRTNEFSPLGWEPSMNRLMASSAARFIKEHKFEKQTHLNKAVLAILRETKANPELTVFLISDGREFIQGTPFDLQINQQYTILRRGWLRAKTPLLTTLVAQGGAITSWTVSKLNDPTTPKVSLGIEPGERLQPLILEAATNSVVIVTEPATTAPQVTQTTPAPAPPVALQIQPAAPAFHPPTTVAAPSETPVEQQSLTQAPTKQAILPKESEPAAPQKVVAEKPVVPIKTSTATKEVVSIQPVAVTSSAQETKPSVDITPSSTSEPVKQPIPTSQEEKPPTALKTTVQTAPSALKPPPAATRESNSPQKVTSQITPQRSPSSTNKNAVVSALSTPVPAAAHSWKFLVAAAVFLTSAVILIWFFVKSKTAPKSPSLISRYLDKK